MDKIQVYPERCLDLPIHSVKVHATMENSALPLWLLRGYVEDAAITTAIWITLALLNIGLVLQV